MQPARPIEALAVFTIQERATDRLSDIVPIIERHGFEILQTIELTPRQRQKLREPCSQARAGRLKGRLRPAPAMLMIAYDFRHRVEAARNERHCLKLKTAVAQAIAPRSGIEHSPFEACSDPDRNLRCLQALGDAALIPAIRREMESIHQRTIQLPWPIERELSRGRRAQVLLVDHPEHGKAVAKVFHRCGSRFLQRELTARRELADLGHVPPLLAAGDSWILSPFFEDTGRHRKRRLIGTREAQLTYDAARELAAFVLKLRSRGYYLLDLTTHNLMTVEGLGLVILDVEFLQEYRGDPLPIEFDFSVTGVSLYEDADQPDVPILWHTRSRKSVFDPAISGLSIEELIRPPSLYLKTKMRVVQRSWWSVFVLWAAWKKVQSGFLLAMSALRTRKPAESPDRGRLRDRPTYPTAQAVLPGAREGAARSARRRSRDIDDPISCP
ncbi:MAG TPA: hypothetical protein VFM42_00750 [Sphingomicrobium sp.]|nr:hypothetical protein [Sphingomicrobium sp.]